VLIQRKYTAKLRVHNDYTHHNGEDGSCSAIRRVLHTLQSST